jgi:CRP-like cAMP-binding protein
MPVGLVLYVTGETSSYAYFPTTAIVSLLHVLDDGSSAEVATVGNEGMLDISLIKGSQATSCCAVVQSAGMGFRVKAEALKEEFATSAATMDLLLRYVQTLLIQMAQTAACNRYHSTDQ